MAYKQDHLDVADQLDMFYEQDHSDIDKQYWLNMVDWLDKVENQDQWAVVDKRDQEHKEVVVSFDDM